MTYQIERHATVYSVTNGEYKTWRKLRNHKSDAPLEWRTRREAEGFRDLLVSRVSEALDYRVIEVSEVKESV